MSLEPAMFDGALPSPEDFAKVQFMSLNAVALDITIVCSIAVVTELFATVLVLGVATTIVPIASWCVILSPPSAAANPCLILGVYVSSVKARLENVTLP